MTIHATPDPAQEVEAALKEYRRNPDYWTRADNSVMCNRHPVFVAETRKDATEAAQYMNAMRLSQIAALTAAQAENERLRAALLEISSQDANGRGYYAHIANDALDATQGRLV